MSNTLPYPIEQAERVLPAYAAGLRLMLLALFLALQALPLPSLAQTSVYGNSAAPSEERVKAAFLLRFIGYVEWPVQAFASPNSPYVIGTIHADNIASELTALAAGRTVGSRPITVKKLQANDSLEGLHILFIGGADRNRLEQRLKPLQQQPVLVVTESEDALSLGSMINFRMIEDRVRFEVALAPGEKAGLKFNSRMLGVAHAVIKGPPQ